MVPEGALALPLAADLAKPPAARRAAVAAPRLALCGLCLDDLALWGHATGYAPLLGHSHNSSGSEAGQTCKE